MTFRAFFGFNFLFSGMVRCSELTSAASHYQLFETFMITYFAFTMGLAIMFKDKAFRKKLCYALVLVYGCACVMI